MRTGQQIGREWGLPVTEQPTDAGVLVIVPTYNERDNVEVIVERLFTASPDTHVLIVDDASPDGTGKIAGR